MRARASLLALAALLAACARDRAPSGASSDHFGDALTLTVRTNPENVVTAFADVTVTGADAVAVEYGDTADYGSTTPRLDVPPWGQVTAVLLGVPAGGRFHARVVAFYKGGGTHTTGDVGVDNVPLPSDVFFPPTEIRTDDGSATGYLLASVLAGNPAGHVGAMFDRRGRPMWYRRGTGTRSTIFDRLPNGHFVMYEDANRTVEEYDLGGELLRTWSVPATVAEDGVDDHEFQYVAETDHAWAIGMQTNPSDAPGATAKGRRLDSTVLDLDGQGGGRVVWSSYPEITWDELTFDATDPPDQNDWEPVHANSVEPTPDGMLLVSCRDISAVLKINPATGGIVWRLGGTKSDFTIVDDPLLRFTRQHDARLTPEGHLRVYDNGVLHPAPGTRVVEYAIDEVARTATFVSAYWHTPGLYNPFAGSARLVPGGRLLVDYASLGVFTEIDESQRVRWEVVLPGANVYRVETTPSLFP